MYAVAGHGERAACLVEAGVIIRDSSGVPQPPERDETEAAVVPARRALGEAAWAAAFAAGRAMTLEEAIAEALDEGGAGGDA